MFVAVMKDFTSNRIGRLAEKKPPKQSYSKSHVPKGFGETNLGNVKTSTSALNLILVKMMNIASILKVSLNVKFVPKATSLTETRRHAKVCRLARKSHEIIFASSFQTSTNAQRDRLVRSARNASTEKGSLNASLKLAIGVSDSINLQDLAKILMSVDG